MVYKKMSKLSDYQKETALWLVKDGHRLKDIAYTFNVSVSTISRLVKKDKNDKNNI